jgi:hypothetical protein
MDRKERTMGAVAVVVAAVVVPAAVGAASGGGDDIYVLAILRSATWSQHYAVPDGGPFPDPYGVYDVEEMRREGEIATRLPSDATYWHADGSQETLAQPGPTRGTWTWTHGRS